MTMIHTAHGVGEVVETVTERGGRVSYKVKVGLNEVWVKAADARFAEGGPENLFSYQFTPDRHIDPTAEMYGASTPEKDFVVGNVFAMGSKGFSPMAPAKSVRDIKRPYPYDPTPQYPVDMFTDSTIQPGEYEIDPDKRLKPSQPSTQPPSPGPSPSLFATGAYSAIQDRPEIVLGSRPGSDEDYLIHEGFFAEAEELTDEQRGKRREDYPRQSRDPAADRPRLREHDEPVLPFDKVSPSGHTTHEMGKKSEPDWYSCPDCGAWHNPFRHMKNRRGPKPPRSDDAFQPAYKGASMRCAACEHDHQEHGMGYHEGEGEFENYQPPWERSAEGRHRAPPNEVDPFIDTLDRGALPELVRDPGNDQQVFMKRTPTPKPRGEHFAPGIMDRLRGRAAGVFDGIEFPTDMPEKFAYIPGPEDFTDSAQTALAAITRQAAILEGEYGLSPRVAVEMDLVEHDAHVREAAWRDVQRKAKRLRAEGRVHIKDSSPEHIVATVDGDTGTYDTIIVRGNVFDLGGQSVTSWHCGCDWGRWAFKRRLTYVGRFCSHAYATYQEMRSAHDLPGGTRSRTRSAGSHEFADPTDEADARLQYEQSGARPVAPGSDAYLHAPRPAGPPIPGWVGQSVEGGEPGRHRAAGVVEDYKKWLKENDQVPGVDSVADFVTLPQDDDEEAPLTEDEVAKLYDYAEGNLPESRERNYDVGYTFDPDEVYKTSREMLRTKPQSLTPDLQFVPEGEDEHLVDVTKDDRKTTGPGQIMHGNTDDEGGQEPGDGEIVHFASLQRLCDTEGLPYPVELTAFLQHYAEEQKVNNPTPGSPANPRPDAGEATRDLNKLRNLIQDPLSDSFGHMDERNDKVRDLVEELHDAGTAAENLVASRQFEAEGDFASPGGGTWADLPFAGSGPDPKDWYSSSADYVDEHERPNFTDVTDLPDGDILKYNDSDSPVSKPKEARYEHEGEEEDYGDEGPLEAPSDAPWGEKNPRWSPRHADLFSNETSSMQPMEPNVGGGGPGDVNNAPPIMNAGDNVSGAEEDPTGTLASLLHFADDDDLTSGDTMGDPGGGMTDGGGNSMGMGGGDSMGGGGDWMGTPSGGLHYPGLDTDSGGVRFGPMSPDSSTPSATPGLPGGAGASDFVHPSGPVGAPGDMIHPDKSVTYANQQRPSIRDSIAKRNQHWRHGYDWSNVPPGWGDVPSNPDDDSDPLPPLPGQKEVENLLPNQMPKIPGMGKGGPGGAGGAAGEAGMAEELPLVAASIDPRWDQSDVVAQFQRSAGAAALRGRGQGGPPQSDPRAQAMSQWGGAPGGVTRAGSRGNFSEGDIAGAAASFLHRTAGRTYSPAEQASLMNEEPVNGRGARNLGGLDLQGTHYVQ